MSSDKILNNCLLFSGNLSLNNWKTLYTSTLLDFTTFCLTTSIIRWHNTLSLALFLAGLIQKHAWLLHTTYEFFGWQRLFLRSLIASCSVEKSDKKLDRTELLRMKLINGHSEEVTHKVLNYCEHGKNSYSSTLR